MWHGTLTDHALRHPEPIPMTRAQTFRLSLPAALAALALVMPLEARQQQDSYTLPETAPTPTPAPAGPADERAGVAIPPRPAATPAPTPSPAPAPSPSPSPLRLPQPAASPSAPRPANPAPQAAPPAAPAAETQAEPASEDLAEPGEQAAEPGFSELGQSAGPAVQADAPDPAPARAPSEPLGEPVLAWGWLAGAAALLAALLGALAFWRRRKPKVLRLAPPPPTAEDGGQPALPRLDLALDITGATRSLMMFTLQYRLTMANRTDRAVNDLAVAVQLTSAQRGAGNAAPLAAARSLASVERIGPHQSRSITGEVQIPVAAITPMMQGRTALFIPLVHVTVEGDGQQALARSFVVGSRGSAEGRVRPLILDLPPGSVPGLIARPIATPAN